MSAGVAHPPSAFIRDWTAESILTIFEPQSSELQKAAGPSLSTGTGCAHVFAADNTMDDSLPWVERLDKCTVYFLLDMLQFGQLGEAAPSVAAHSGAAVAPMTPETASALAAAHSGAAARPERLDPAAGPSPSTGTRSAYVCAAVNTMDDILPRVEHLDEFGADGTAVPRNEKTAATTDQLRLNIAAMRAVHVGLATTVAALLTAARTQGVLPLRYLGEATPSVAARSGAAVAPMTPEAACAVVAAHSGAAAHSGRL